LHNFATLKSAPDFRNPNRGESPGALVKRGSGCVSPKDFAIDDVNTNVERAFERPTC
jgi:hypothetical protein